MKKILFMLLFSSSFIYSKELMILDYKTGVLTSEFPCQFKFYDNWILDEYSCEIKRNDFDKVKVFSDKWTYLVGRVYRYLIVDKDSVDDMISKLESVYGSRNKTLYERGSSVNQMMFWGNAYFQFDMQRQEDAGTKFYHPAFLPFLKIADDEIALQVSIHDCLSTSSSCYDEFKISDNDEKVIFEFNLFNDKVRGINSDAFTFKKDPRTEKEKMEVKNKNISEIEI